MTISPIDHRVSADDSVVMFGELVPVHRASDERLAPDRLPVDPTIVDRPALRLCRCGHEQDAHEHYRTGDDCGVCGVVRCRSFRLRTGRGARSSTRRRRSGNGLRAARR